MKIVATICSRKKSDSVDLLAAQERYLGAHIGQVREIAKNESVPMYILSGMFGLISAEEKIPNYDYLLTEEAVPELVKKIAEQIREAGITEIAFYSESNPNWKPYEQAGAASAEAAGVSIVMHML